MQYRFRKRKIYEPVEWCEVHQEIISELIRLEIECEKWAQIEDIEGICESCIHRKILKGRLKKIRM